MTHPHKVVIKRVVDGVTVFDICDPDECADAEPLFNMRDDIDGPGAFKPLTPIEPHDKRGAYEFAILVMNHLLGGLGRQQRVTVERLARQRAQIFLDGGTPDHFHSDEPLEFLSHMMEHAGDAASTTTFDPASHMALRMIWNRLQETGKDIPLQLRQWIARSPTQPARKRGYNRDRAVVQEDLDELTQGLVEFCSLLGPVRKTGLPFTPNPLSEPLSICHAVSKVLMGVGYPAGYPSVRQKVMRKTHLERLRRYLDSGG